MTDALAAEMREGLSTLTGEALVYHRRRYYIDPNILAILNDRERFIAERDAERAARKKAERERDEAREQAHYATGTAEANIARAEAAEAENARLREERANVARPADNDCPVCGHDKDYLCRCECNDLANVRLASLAAEGERMREANDAAVERIARMIAEELFNYSWDGMREEPITGFPVTRFDSFGGTKLQGGKDDLRRLVSAALAPKAEGDNA